MNRTKTITTAAERFLLEATMNMKQPIILTTLLCLLLTACSGDSPANNRTTYSLDANASGVIEKVNNIVNMTVVSKDTNDLKAEYRAGFVQGKLQGRQIISARDNNWDDAYLVDPGHTFPKQPGPTRAELDQAGGLLNDNYNAFITYLRSPATDATTAHLLKRLLFS